MLVYDGTVAQEWKDYYTYGGLSLVFLQQSEEVKMNYLKGQLKNVCLNDIIDCNRVQNEEQINAVVEILAPSIGLLTNPLKLSNTFRGVINLPIADKTVSNYLAYLEDAFLMDKSKRYDVKGKKVSIYPIEILFYRFGIMKCCAQLSSTRRKSHYEKRDLSRTDKARIYRRRWHCGNRKTKCGRKGRS